MKKRYIVGISLFSLTFIDFSHAIRVWSPSESQFLDINFLIQTWLRHQNISSKNRPNFVNADNTTDLSFRRIRIRFGGSLNQWFKFNLVIRLNNVGRDAYIAPFGGQPAGYLRQGELLGGRNFALHELDLRFALHKLFDTKDWIVDVHLGFPRVPLGREQFGRTGFDNIESDRTFATLRWTHLTVGNVTGRSYGGYIHLRKGNNGKGFGKITWDAFLGVFDGFKGIEQPWDETVRGTDISAYCNAACLSQLRGNSKDSFLLTLRTTLMIGKPEGKPNALNWLYRDTYIGKRKGITLGFSFAMQNDIDQELITDTQGPAPGLSGAGTPSPGAGSVQVRVPYMILPNPVTTPEVRNNPVDMRMYGADLAVHYGPFTFIVEAGQQQFKGVFLDSLKPSEDFKNKWFIVKTAYALNPKSTTVLEPYFSYYIWNPDIKEDSEGRAYGDATNFIRANKNGKDRATLGRLDVTSIGFNIWYTKAKLMGFTFEYQIIKEERNEIDNNAFTVQFRFVF
ncbi:MAG TPA: porin [Aquificaceae bacterium]|nr:porin [Aquificaceae bacterium]HIQ48662.1 porin [Aquifex aeolicus]